MLIYRNNRRPRAAAELLRSFCAAVEQTAAAPRHDDVRDLLVAFDEIESAVADALNPDSDGEAPLLSLFRSLALDFGRIFLHSWQGSDVRAALEILSRRVGACLALPGLPLTIWSAEAEGYAWYGLFPETYLAAARSFREECRPRSAVCLGIRQVGASLSAVVAAALSETGCPVHLRTVRPRGHPFERVFLPSDSLKRSLLDLAEGAYFLIVDEGPGLSGSSICSVAEALSGWGVPDERIVFFSAWAPDGSGFLSPSARQRWPRHRNFTAPFESVWPGLQLSACERLDLSAGRWRPVLLDRPAAFPPVQPQHERRKYLLFSPARPLPETSAARRQVDPESLILAKFAGFGRHGRSALERAGRLAQAGFGPPVVGTADGFLLTRFLRGRLLRPGRAGNGFLDAAAGYLACLQQEFPAAHGVSPAELMEMIRVNTSEALGEAWAARLARLPELFVYAPATAIDGRLFPHEWVKTGHRFVKTDGVEHHADHFYPGCTDIAWDMAATEIEFRLKPHQSGYLLGRYAALSGDAGISRRVPFYRLAYLAFRLGYATMAARHVDAADECGRFLASARRYRLLLRSEIRRTGF